MDMMLVLRLFLALAGGTAAALGVGLIINVLVHDNSPSAVVLAGLGFLLFGGGTILLALGVAGPVIALTQLIGG